MELVDGAVWGQHLMNIRTVLIGQAVEIVVQQKRRREQAEDGIVVDRRAIIAEFRKIMLQAQARKARRKPIEQLLIRNNVGAGPQNAIRIYAIRADVSGDLDNLPAQFG